VRRLEPGAFPPAGVDVQVSGPYYVVEGVVIRYTSKDDS
jgi:hypothetical protein